MESVEACASDSDYESWLDDYIASEWLEEQLPSVDEGEGAFSSDPSRDPYIQCGGDTTTADNSFDHGPLGAPRPGDAELVQASSLPFDGTVNASSSDLSRKSTYYHDVGDEVTVADFITDMMNQDLPASRPGGDELVATNTSPFNGNFNAYSSDSSVNSYFQQDSFQLGEQVSLQYSLGDLGLPPPLPGSEEIHMQVDSSGTPDNAFDQELQSVDAVRVGSAGRRWPVVEPGNTIGVGERSDNGTWEARVWLKHVNLPRNRNGMQCFVGSFATKDDAKRAHDKVAIKLDVRVSKDGTLYSLNHPEKQYADEMSAHASWSRRDYLWKMRRESEKFSKGKCELKGVQPKKSGKPGYTATISVTQGKKTSLTIGNFESEDEAGRAYDRALLFIRGMYDLGCIPNFRPESYTAAEVQEVGQQLAADHPDIDFKAIKRKHCGVFA